MKAEKQHKLSFYGVDILNINFQSLKPFNFQEEIKLGIEADIVREKGSNDFKVYMSIDLGVEDFFSFSIAGLGSFEINNDGGNINENDILNLININAPAIMFPFMRSTITTFTSNMGGNVIPTIIIPPQFIQGNVKSVE